MVRYRCIIFMMRDDGYFPRGTSILRRVQEQRAVGLFYGQRALCIGALNTRAYVGTSEHTANKHTPFRRLSHTGVWFEDVMLGSRDEADRVLAAVHRMHSRVNGGFPQKEGPYPAGTPYDAFDPELMLWTMAVMMDSAVCFHDLLVRRLSAGEKEALWQEYIRFAELFGMPRDVAPPTYTEFREYFDGFIASDRVWLTQEARLIGYATAFEIPMATFAQPFKKVHDVILLGSLPPRVRRIYHLPWTPAHDAAFRAAVRAVKTGRTVLPGSMAQGRNTYFFKSVAAEEASRIARGKQTPQVLQPS